TINEMAKPIACIVLPTFNEAENVPTVLSGIFSQADAIPTHELHVLVVDGSRFAPGGAIPGLPWYRRLISLAGTRLVRWFGGIPPIRDCTSGYRVIRADLIPHCDLEHLSTRGYSFQSSLLCELLRNGARLVETPIIFSGRAHGESKLSFLDQWEFVVNLFRLRLLKTARDRAVLRSRRSAGDRVPLK